MTSRSRNQSGDTELREFYQNKRILITGGLGFIGSNLAHDLVKLGADVTLVDSMIPQYGGNLFNIEGIKDKARVNISDVRDGYSMDHLVQKKALIFNLAGTLSHIDSLRDPYTDLEINCRSQLSILESCRKFNPEVKIVFTGTRGQYGKTEYLPVDENHPLNPIDVNGINNVAGEMYHLLYHKIYGIRAVSLRLTNTYGPRHQMRHPRQGIINWFVRLAIDNERINLYGDGSQVRDANYVSDVVSALLLAGQDGRADGEVFNLGGEARSLLEIVRALIKINKGGFYSLKPFPEDLKNIEIGDYIASFNKIKGLLGWRPKIDLEEGLAQTIRFYKKFKRHYW